MTNYNTLPEHMREPMRRYIEERKPIGDFLQAVISNNLVESFGRADAINSSRMKDFASFLYNEAPMDSWGSEEKMVKWLKG